MNKIRILIVEDVSETRALIKKILSLKKEMFEVVGEAENGELALRAMPKCKPDVVLMDINMPVMNGIKATELIADRYPETNVIMMSVQTESEYLKDAMFAGAKGYITKPINYDELTETIKATYEKNQDRKALREVIDEKDRAGKVLSFYSFKGGVGKSVLSLNSSIVMSKYLGNKTLLIDMDLHFGDISLMCNGHMQKTIIDLIDDQQWESYERMKPYLHQYNDNLDILFAPRNAESAEYVSKEGIEKIMKKLKTHYDVIIVDTGVNFDDVTLYMLDMTDTIFFVSSMEMASLKNAKIGLNVMKSLNYGSDKVKVLINEASEKYGVNKRSVEKVFENDVFAYIPEDMKNVRLSVNNGIPVCDIHRNRGLKFTKAIKDLSIKVMQEEA